MKFTIVKKSKFAIEAKNDQGQTLMLGYQKHALKLMELRTKKEGDTFEAEVDTSDQGRLYCVEHTAVEAKFLEAEKIVAERDFLTKRSRILAAQLAKAEL